MDIQIQRELSSSISYVQMKQMKFCSNIHWQWNEAQSNISVRSNEDNKGASWASQRGPTRQWVRLGQLQIEFWLRLGSNFTNRSKIKLGLGRAFRQSGLGLNPIFLFYFLITWLLYSYLYSCNTHGAEICYESRSSPPT